MGPTISNRKYDVSIILEIKKIKCYKCHPPTQTAGLLLRTGSCQQEELFHLIKNKNRIKLLIPGLCQNQIYIKLNFFDCVNIIFISNFWSIFRCRKSNNMRRLWIIMWNVIEPSAASEGHLVFLIWNKSRDDSDLFSLTWCRKLIGISQ